MAVHNFPAPTSKTVGSPTISVGTLRQHHSLPAPTSLTVSIQLDPEWPYAPTNPVVISVPGHHLVAWPLVLGSPGGEIAFPFPPLVWLLNSARLDEHPENFAKKLQEATFTNFNDKIAFDIDSKTLVGRTDAGRGPAQRIAVMPPLRLDHSKLDLDQSEFWKLQQQLAAETEARIQAIAAETIARVQAIANEAAARAAWDTRLTAATPAPSIYLYSAVVTILGTKAKVTLQGSGGGGGGVVGGYGGGAGGNGAVCVKVLTGLMIGNTLILTVPEGGTASQSGSAGGNAAATTLVSGTQTISTLTAGGGNGGAPGDDSLGATGQSGANGVATGGDLNVNGPLYGGNGGVGSFGGPFLSTNGRKGCAIIEWYY